MTFLFLLPLLVLHGRSPIGLLALVLRVLSLTILLRVFLFCAHPLTLVQVAFMRPSHVPCLVMVRFLLLVLFLATLPVCSLRLLLLWLVTPVTCLPNRPIS